LANVKKIFSSETTWPNGAKLGKGNNSQTGNQIYFKIAGHVDLDKLNMFSVYTQHLSLIVFEINDEKY
jgi:hypothetical protein